MLRYNFCPQKTGENVFVQKVQINVIHFLVTLHALEWCEQNKTLYMFGLLRSLFVYL